MRGFEEKKVIWLNKLNSIVWMELANGKELEELEYMFEFYLKLVELGWSWSLPLKKTFPHSYLNLIFLLTVKANGGNRKLHCIKIFPMSNKQTRERKRSQIPFISLLLVKFFPLDLIPELRKKIQYPMWVQFSLIHYHPICNQIHANVSFLLTRSRETTEYVMTNHRGNRIVFGFNVISMSLEAT